MATADIPAQDLICPRYILCDMDGTLVDTEELKSEAWWRAVLEAAGRPVPRADVDSLYAQLVGGVAREMTKAFVAKFHLGVTPERLYELREKHRVLLYEDREQLRGLLRHEVAGFLQALRTGAAMRGGLRLVLVTTAPWEQVDVVFEATGMRALFDDVVCGLEKSAANPACYRAALEKLGCGPGECIALEDSPAGYQASRAAGIPCLMVPNRFTRDRSL